MKVRTSKFMVLLKSLGSDFPSLLWFTIVPKNPEINLNEGSSEKHLTPRMKRIYPSRTKSGDQKY